MTDCRAWSASNPFSVCNSGQKRISAYTTFFLHSLWHKSRVACLSCSSFCKNWLQKSKTPQFFPFSARFEFFLRAESFCSWSQLLRLSQGFSTGKSIPCFAASSSINSNHEISKILVFIYKTCTRPEVFLMSYLLFWPAFIWQIFLEKKNSAGSLLKTKRLLKSI